MMRNLWAIPKWKIEKQIENWNLVAFAVRYVCVRVEPNVFAISVKFIKFDEQRPVDAICHLQFSVCRFINSEMN